MGFKAAYVAILFVWLGCSGQDAVTIQGPLNEQPNANSPLDPCPDNPDSLYTGSEVLEQLVDIVNNTLRKRGTEFSVSYSPRYRRGAGFFIYDLSDTTNHNLNYQCVRFIENHVYHFSPGLYHYSISHISHLADGELTTFTALNCEGRGDSIEDVVRYLEDKLESNPSRDELINRVRDYRNYGYYGVIDYVIDPCWKGK